MKQGTRVIAAAAVFGLVALGAVTRPYWSPPGAVAQAPPAARVIPVEVAKAVKKPAPVIIEALGTVTPIQSVAVRTRLDSEIVGVHFEDGASVRQGDPLDRKSTRLNSSHVEISYAVFCLKKKKPTNNTRLRRNKKKHQFV